jgi:hypothetical protein
LPARRAGATPARPCAEASLSRPSHCFPPAAASITERMASSNLSPRGALFIGLASAIVGVLPILTGLGVFVPDKVEPGTPAWVLVCAGLMFVVAGVTIIVNYAFAGGVGPDGDFRTGTRLAVRAASLLLGLVILALMIAVMGWIAFGSGPRRFSSTFALPFLTRRWASSETSGRMMFGAATVVMVMLFVGCGAVGFARLWHARNR